MSKSIKLNELGRILSRNKFGFALVENEYMVTASDLLRHLAQSKGVDATKAASGVQPQNTATATPADDNGAAN